MDSFEANPMRTTFLVMLAMTSLALGAEPGPAGRLVLVAGGGTGGDGVPAREARLTSPFGTGFNAGGTRTFFLDPRFGRTDAILLVVSAIVLAVAFWLRFQGVGGIAGYRG